MSEPVPIDHPSFNAAAVKPSAGQVRPRLPSLRVLITLIVVLPIAVVSVALVSIATVTTSLVADQLGEEIVRGATSRVIGDVRNYLNSAIRVSDLYTRRILDGTLPTSDLPAWERMLFEDIAMNPDVASICFATPQGDCTWLLRAHGRLELGIVRGDARDRAVEYPADLTGTVDRSNPIRIYPYDALERSWYKAALEHAAPLWTDIYFWFPDQKDARVTGTGYTRAIRDGSGRLLGVLIIDVTLGALSEHLRELTIPPVKHTFLVDEKGLMVAASEGEVSSEEGERISPADSSSAAARAVAPLLTVDVHGEDIDAPEVATDRVMVGRDPARARVTEIKPFPGIHWHVVTILPEATFMFPVEQVKWQAIMLAGGATLGGVGLGLLLAKRLSQPLEALTAHVARVGEGDFDSRLHLSHAAELYRLSEQVNQMAGGLKHRMMLEQAINVATGVQQSLLPASIPAMNGLEVAACSKYCESTGGDYYDFIRVPGFEAHKTLIAVGDVTGHGIGAAMLMSTARGAVLSASLGAPSLGHILTRTNDVLAGSVQHGMFMTLSLLFINPATGFAHWSSAGHDPVIVYHPDTDAFEELLSGDLPMGIEPEIAYREFSRRCATPGSVFLIGTDGIWEARNASGEMFGKQRLHEVIRSACQSAEGVSAAIKQAMSGWVGDVPLQDDVTFVVVRVKRDESADSAALQS